MALIKYNPYNYTPQSFRNFFDMFLDADLNGGTSLTHFIPKTDFFETSNTFELDFHLPGIKKEEIKVDLSGDELTVSGERKLSRKDNKEFHKTLESQYGKFSRSFHLPDNIKKEDIDASFKNGVLHISIPKDKKALANQTIPIK